MNLDSLLGVMPGVAQDTTAVELYIQIGQQYETNQPLIAQQYYKKAGELSTELEYPLGFCKYAANYTAVLNMQGQYDSSLIINLKALQVAEEWNDKMWITKMRFNVGNCYNYKLQYETALAYYQQVIPYFEEVGNKPYLALIYDVMQVLYQNLRQYPKAIAYGEKSIALFDDDPGSNALGNTLLNLSVNYLYNIPSQPEKAMKGFDEALQIARDNQNLYLESMVLLNIADLHYRHHDMDKARPYYEQALVLQKETDDREGICIASRGLAYYELYRDNYDEAERLILDVLAIATENNFLKEIVECYASLSELALAKRDFLQYRHFLQRKDSVQTIILNDELTRATQDKETKYETERKELKLIALEKQRKLGIAFTVIGAIFSILLIVILVFRQRVISHKKVLAEEMIKRLEQEKQLTASQALMEGENAERKRLARDLHDGLGGMLSVVKLNLNNMKGNIIMPEADVPAFHNALEMLDGSIRELRRVAHNLMPETLLRYGLKPAFADFCHNVDIVKFHFFGDDRRIDEKFEVAVYRIFLELVNNALKHAAAEQINVQLIIEDSRINLVVQDNGKGFDPALVDQAKTTGLSSIRSRVESLNGQLEIYSAPAKGTEVQVEFRF
ncbi:MAG: sensor histidine kinase [Cyclobacteriaceae bacterium]|nr:sensor histidine kinase [Cyclobacteriaceae bacterium]